MRRLWAWKGHGKPDPKKTYNRLHAPGERAFVQLENLAHPAQTPLQPHRTTNITRAITVLIHTG